MPRRILVIDDAPDLRQLYREILEDEGFEVTTSDCDPPATQDVVQLQPSAIIVDCMLGKQPRGLRFLHQLKANTLTNAIPVILATTARQPMMDELEPFLHEHQVTVLAKPFALDDLLNVLMAR
ncbi:MAG: response regulator [Chloroflexota bacterium]|nr:response regulator [Chloroflexota bacterium]